MTSVFEGKTSKALCVYIKFLFTYRYLNVCWKIARLCWFSGGRKEWKLSFQLSFDWLLLPHLILRITGSNESWNDPGRTFTSRLHITHTRPSIYAEQFYSTWKIVWNVFVVSSGYCDYTACTLQNDNHRSLLALSLALCLADDTQLKTTRVCCCSLGPLVQ